MAKITDQFIRALQVPQRKPEVQEFDDELPGFGVRKQESGHVSLFVKYSIGKKQRRKTFAWVAGTLAAIRKEAAVVLAQARLGKDVVGEARKAQQEAKQAKTLGELVGPYLELREMGNEFWKPLRVSASRSARSSHAGGPFVAIGGYFSWRSLRMRSLRALMAANSRCAHIVAAMPHPKPITNIVI